MRAKSLINEYKREHGVKGIKDIPHIKQWLEKRLCKRMNRPLFIAVGAGGGQTYKTLWEVFDITGNKNTPCYYYNENNTAIIKLNASKHLPLDTWINDPDPRLKI